MSPSDKISLPRDKIVIVPRIPDEWVGIDEVRSLLPNCWFHERTDKPVESETGAKLTVSSSTVCSPAHGTSSVLHSGQDKHDGSTSYCWSQRRQ